MLDNGYRKKLLFLNFIFIMILYYFACFQTWTVLPTESTLLKSPLCIDSDF